MKLCDMPDGYVKVSYATAEAIFDTMRNHKVWDIYQRVMEVKEDGRLLPWAPCETPLRAWASDPEKSSFFVHHAILVEYAYDDLLRRTKST